MASSAPILLRRATAGTTIRRSFVTASNRWSSFSSQLSAAKSAVPSPPGTSTSTSTSTSSSSGKAPFQPDLIPGSLPSSFALHSPSTRFPTAGENPDVVLLETLARLIMQSGMLDRAHSHLRDMLEHIHLTTSTPPLPLLHKAIELVEPSVRIVQRRKGTKSLPTPQPLTAKQRRRQAWKWIVDASEKRLAVEKNFGKRLALEVVAVLTGQSEALKQKEARHRQGSLARANVPR